MSLNPWLAVPSEPPYVLPCDSCFIHKYNEKAREEHRLQTQVLPEPFVGSATAPVLLLALNPGFDDLDPVIHARPGFQALVRRSYAEAESPFPFYYLDPGFDGPGRKWWESKLKPLLAIFKREELARSLICVQYFPYHSRRFRHRGLKLPSQEFGFALVRSAIAKNTTIVIMRAKTTWEKGVPRLKGYSHAFTLHSPQNVVVSLQNCPGFDAVVSAIRNGNGS